MVNAGTVGGYFKPGGMYGGYSGYHEWIDYCPLCDHYSCLMVNPKGTIEGEVTCAFCDADFDGCTGYDKHGGGARARLYRYVPEPEPEPVPEPEPEPIPIELSPWEKAHQCFRENEILVLNS